ncbi:MAG: hypothetical protein ACTSUE_14035 [Promethearchaeota archaeon]
MIQMCVPGMEFALDTTLARARPDTAVIRVVSGIVVERRARAQRYVVVRTESVSLQKCVNA